MKITVEPTAPAPLQYEHNKITIETKSDNLTVSEMIELFERMLYALGYGEIRLG